MLRLKLTTSKGCHTATPGAGPADARSMDSTIQVAGTQHLAENAQPPSNEKLPY